MTITLRHITTGAAVTAVSSRDGRYSFHNLPEGEYTLTASSSRGSGALGGITISPAHESHIQAAIDLAVTVLPADALLNPRFISAPAPNEGESVKASDLLRRMAVASPPHDIAPAVATTAIIASAQLDSLGLTGRQMRPALFLPTSLVISVAPFKTLPAPQLDMIQLIRLDGSLLASGGPPLLDHSAETGLSGISSPSHVLTSAQLASLPVAGRDWGSLLGDTGAAPVDGTHREQSEGEASTPLSIDGHVVGTAFGHARMIGLTSLAESAIGEVRSAGAERSESISVQTQRGADRLHGQVFLSNRQHLLSAQNPFAAWVKETEPQSGAAVPVFASEPYSPSDLELRWGFGAGGVFKRRHLFWFAALDGFDRDHPAVSSVRHPEHFFAQPANDQMQLLSAQLGLSSVDPVAEGVSAYSKLLESLAGLLGPAPRRSRQLSGFTRIDWNVGERHRLTLESIVSRFDTLGGVSTRAWQNYGTSSLGSLSASRRWFLGRWEVFLAPNLLATAQGSIGQDVQFRTGEPPSAFEQSLNINGWGQLPQIVVDSRDGFTIGNPSHFGKGKYPDGSIYTAQPQLKWIRGSLLLSSGFELKHETDATSRLLNQTGTYHYSTIGDFASDALAFSSFGLSGQLNPMHQHNCDQRGRPWRDTAGVLHGLGYLPCYSYYTQTLGPSDWWLSTNDLAGYSTSQWQPARRAVFTLAARWELELLPPPIRHLDNPDLPLTQRLPAFGSQWGPRVGFAWGTDETRWPVLRLGYGMYFSRTPNAMIETALTQTGSAAGDLKFLLRPTDNLYGGGAPPFPYVLAGPPGTGIKPQAVEFAPQFRNGEVHQAELSLDKKLPWNIHLDTGVVASFGRKLPIVVDANIDPAANPKTITYTVVDGASSGPIKAPQVKVPFFAAWPSATSSTGFEGRLNPNYQQISEVFSRANSTYEALVVRLSRNARGLSFRGRYTFSHAADWNPNEGVDIDSPSLLDPGDFRQEYGTSSLDVRSSATAAIILQPTWKLRNLPGQVLNNWLVSGVAQFHSGLPFTMRTAGSLAKEFDETGRAIVALGTGMNGYGGDNRVYGVGRNTFRYPVTWKADLRLSKRFNLGQMRQLELMAESFNLFNHQNVTQLETVGYFIEQGTMNGAMPRLSYLTGLKSGQTEFGKPLDINATDGYRERQVQFGARMRF